MLGLPHRGFDLADPDRHPAGYLSDREFEAVLAGQQHESCPGPQPDEAYASDSSRKEAALEHLNYDRIVSGDADAIDHLPIDHTRTHTDLANAAAAAEYIRSDLEDPFFLSLGLYNTHHPMPLDQDRNDPDCVDVPDPLPDHPAVRREVAGFHLLAEYDDECVKRVVKALR